MTLKSRREVRTYKVYAVCEVCGSDMRHSPREEGGFVDLMLRSPNIHRHVCDCEGKEHWLDRIYPTLEYEETGRETIGG